MNDETQQSDRQSSSEVSDFGRNVGAKEQRKLKALQSPKHSVWFGFAMFGLVGWSIVVPTLLGAALGWWLDAHHPSTHSWTLALLIAGLVLGCFNAWRWISREDRDMHVRNHHHE